MDTAEAATTERVQQYQRATHWAVRKFVPYSLRKQEADYEFYRSLAQEGLLRVARRFDPQMGFTFTTYAAKCMQRAITNEIKRQQRRKRTGCWVCADLSPEQKQFVDSVYSPDSVAEFAERESLREQIEGLLSHHKMNPKHRRIARLLWVEGLTEREAARKLKIAFRKVHSTRNSVIQVLQKYLIR